ncbi:MAG: hypothetical protein PHQ18_03660 [Patescibacteria group bacterium]|nr:hypothetical protein [Patescibacteria group bacterium]
MGIDSHSPEEPKEQAPRHHSAIPDRMNTARPDRQGYSLTVDEIAADLLPENDPQNSKLIGAIHKIYESKIGRVPRKAEVFADESSMTYDNNVVDKGYMYADSNQTEMKNPGRTLEAGHLAALLNQVSPGNKDRQMRGPYYLPKVMSLLKTGATLYRHNDSGNGLFVFDSTRTGNYRNYEDKAKYDKTLEDDYTKAETFTLEEKKQMHVLNLLRVQTLLTPDAQNKQDFQLDYSDNKELLPEGVTVTENGFIAMPDENEDEVEERYITIRDEMAARLTKEVNFDVPILPKQALEVDKTRRETIETLRKDVATLQETLAVANAKNDRLRADLEEATKTAATTAEQARRDMASLRVQTGLETQARKTESDQRTVEKTKEDAERERKIQEIKDILSNAGMFSGKAIQKALTLLENLS